MTASPVLAGLLETSVRPNRLRDTQWLDRYLASADGSREPLLLGLGETWRDTPAALVRALAEVPASAHGYQLSMYGLPRLREALESYVSRTQRLDRHAGDFRVAVSWSGTRGAMADYAQLVRDRREGPLTATVVGPSWDYAGVLEPLGFRLRYLDVSRTGWSLDADEVRAFAARGERTDLLVLNPQHNPTGESWSEPALDALLDIARADGSAILVDDAYYGFADGGERRASAVERILDDEVLRDSLWLAVRSLGKQFHCNGWGIGAITASPAVLDDFVNDYRARRAFNTSAVEQHAMAVWLEDEPAVTAYLRGEADTFARRREGLADALAGAGVRPERVVAGPAAPYALIPVPASFPGGADEYLEACAVGPGVFMSGVWPADRTLDRTEPVAADYVRMFLGLDAPGLAEAVSRLHAAGLTEGTAA
ncbi:pyridoxal phosphate-dependent aminotransferase [Kitasatospora sp. NPDC093102]|uniref:pyridoxal phosphate-dependent aminotransferase n=1 Tax=Kitasatospora sp. NPDC093102 TaxID=3155069 RepID=UPI0034478FE2